MTFNTNFSYAYDKPATSGTIKTCPEDFRVVELPDYSTSGSGEHVYLKIRKTNANTGWVAGQLADFTGTSNKDVGFAGRKDRYAIAEQWFSCYLPGEQNPKWEKLEVEGVELLDVTRHTRKLRKGDLSGNFFELTLQQVSPEPEDHQTLEVRLQRLRDSGAPNYFGEQRFGRDNGNLECADKLLKGCKSIRRNRDIYLSVARAYMFNHFLSTKISEESWSAISDDESGPMYGMSRDPRPGEDRLPGECERWCEGLQKLRVKTGSRNLKLKPRDLHWRFEGESLHLSFSLVAGSFATSALREVMDYKESDH
ncbi:MAG: hypothetical protein CMQ19_15080 [Gammaproteobacteria bacterium]|nr:hypothetical protein [Gammaproteobacteria bacterium]|tara:strand:+ start:492 stop:1421 length:930 start_codon:yes stop_codon:yes gene_type:complete